MPAVAAEGRRDALASRDLLTSRSTSTGTSQVSTPRPADTFTPPTWRASSATATRRPAPGAGRGRADRGRAVRALEEATRHLATRRPSRLPADVVRGGWRPTDDRPARRSRRRDAVVVDSTGIGVKDMRRKDRRNASQVRTARSRPRAPLAGNHRAHRTRTDRARHRTASVDRRRRRPDPHRHPATDTQHADQGCTQTRADIADPPRYGTPGRCRPRPTG